MDTSSIVKDKIEKYNPKGGLGVISHLFLSMAEINHSSTKRHAERVALLCEFVAKRMRRDCKAAFFAGLLHDLGKLLLPSSLFFGLDITDKEYKQIKEHAISGFKALRGQTLFTALCAGFHHNLGKVGYGADIGDFPRSLSLATVKKVLEISMIVSICDFIDAFTHRETEIRDGSNTRSKNLRVILYEKYPEDRATIDVALSIFRKK